MNSRLFDCAGPFITFYCPRLRWLEGSSFVIFFLFCFSSSIDQDTSGFIFGKMASSTFYRIFLGVYARAPETWEIIHDDQKWRDSGWGKNNPRDYWDGTKWSWGSLIAETTFPQTNETGEWSFCTQANNMYLYFSSFNKIFEKSVEKFWTDYEWDIGWNSLDGALSYFGGWWFLIVVWRRDGWLMVPYVHYLYNSVEHTLKCRGIKNKKLLKYIPNHLVYLYTYREWRMEDLLKKKIKTK